MATYSRHSDRVRNRADRFREVHYWMVLLAVNSAALFAWALSAGGALSRSVSGVLDGGDLVAWGLPTMRLIAEAAAVLTIGFLIGALAYQPTEPGERLDAVARRHGRVAAVGGLSWAVASIAQLLFVSADITGRPLSSVDISALANTAWLTGQGRAILLATAAGLMVAVLAGITRHAPTLLATLVPTGVAISAVAFAGHAMTSNDQNSATTSLALHILAASIWVGGLAALLAHRRWAPSAVDFAAHRFSGVALVCFVVVVGTGVFNAALRIGSVDALLGTGYGLLLQLKVLAAVLLGLFGFWHRSHTLPALRDRGDAGPFARFAGVELAVMGATIALAVALARSRSPERTIEGELTPARLLLGYPMPEPPTATSLLFAWRPDLFLAGAILVGAGAYLFAVHRLRRAGVAWPLGRTACWLGGLALLFIATGSGLARYGPLLFSVHMMQHMLASMAGPILLVLGAPITLALRSLPTRPHGRPGPREWFVAALLSRPVQLLTNPLVAGLLFVGGLYAMYFTGLYEYTLRNHPAHLLLYLYLIGSGVLFFAVLISPDPLPRPLPYPARFELLLATLAAHAFFGVALVLTRSVIAADWFAEIAHPWGPDPLTDQRTGGGLAWAIGEAPALIVGLVVFLQWIRQNEGGQRRLDRAADRDGDAALEAYNQLLAAPRRTPASR